MFLYHATNQEAEKYIRRIKNPAKKQYATEYLAWIRDSRFSSYYNENEPKWACSYMAAQAVRMDLHNIVRACQPIEYKRVCEAEL